MRKLATVRRVDDIRPIENAEAIEVAVFGGWKVVVKKNEYKKNDLAIYLEVDSFVPHKIAPFLSKGKEPKLFAGVLGERLKTVRLRGQLSQGLVLPMSSLPSDFYVEGQDVSELLGVVKWEPPITTFAPEGTKAQFPSFLVKTDQERIQNLYNDYEDFKSEPEWIYTEKLDGTSFTAYYLDGDFGVCSRNLEIKLDSSSVYTQVARLYDLQEKMESLGRNLAIQGEVLGGKIQKNRYGLSNYQLYLFDVYDIVEGKYLPQQDLEAIADYLGVPTVPILKVGGLPSTLDDLLLEADGVSILGNKPLREGFVVKNKCRTVSFKVISNNFLIKG